MIDTITFDLWNTLLSNSPQDNVRYGEKRVEEISRIFYQNGAKIKFSHLVDAYHRGFEKCKQTWRKNRDLSTEEQLRTVLDLMDDKKLKDIGEDLMDQLVEAFVSPILKDPPDLIDHADEVLKQLKREPYKIGLICNTGRTPGRTIRKLLKQLRIIDYFDVTTFSNEIKIRKPDPRIFLYTLRQLKSQPQSSLHVGDLVDVDILGAKNVGMMAVHFNPDQTSEEDDLPDFTIRRLKDLKWILNQLK